MTVRCLGQVSPALFLSIVLIVLAAHHSFNHMCSQCDRLSQFDDNKHFSMNITIMYMHMHFCFEDL